MFVAVFKRFQFSPTPGWDGVAASARCSWFGFVVDAIFLLDGSVSANSFNGSTRFWRAAANCASFFLLGFTTAIFGSLPSNGAIVEYGTCSNKKGLPSSCV